MQCVSVGVCVRVCVSAPVCVFCVGIFVFALCVCFLCVCVHNHTKKPGCVGLINSLRVIVLLCLCFLCVCVHCAEARVCVAY